MPRPSGKPKYNLSLNSPRRESGTSPSSSAESRRESTPPPSYPSTPTKGGPSSKRQSEKSPFPSSPTTPSKSGGVRGTTQETSYHKRMRNLILDHRKVRREWNELVLGSKGIQLAREVVDLGVEIESSLNRINMLDANSTIPKGRVSIEYLIKQHSKLRKLIFKLYNTIERLGTIVAKMESVAGYAESLVIEASKTKGMDFAFRDSAWNTWSFARFADCLTLISSNYRASLPLMQTLFDTVASSLPDGGTSIPQSLSSSEQPLDSNMLPRFGNPEANHTVTHKHRQNPTQRNKRDSKAENTPHELRSASSPPQVSSLERQAALSYWVCQPLIPDWDDSTKGGERWFEDICEVEIPEWIRTPGM